MYKTENHHIFRNMYCVVMYLYCILNNNNNNKELIVGSGKRTQINLSKTEQNKGKTV